MKTNLIILLFFMFVNASFSQAIEEIQTAFAESYTYENKGEYTKAVNKIKAVYKEDSYEINLRLGWLTYMSGLFNESIAYYEKAIKLMPVSIEARFGVVLPASSMGNWDRVIKAYNKILEIDSENSTANYRMGMIYYGREEYNKSIKYFEKNVNSYPFTYDSLIMYAWCHLKLGKLREAKVLFNKVLMLSPDNESALEGLKLIK